MANEQVSTPNGLNLPEKPSATQVRDLHTYADTDATGDSIHHTLGPGQNQASPGTHRHNGSDSTLLFDGISITGARGGNTALASLIAMMVQFGATDSTTA
jgi:hypothetical protein